jgi:hypothetical protein
MAVSRISRQGLCGALSLRSVPERKGSRQTIVAKALTAVGDQKVTDPAGYIHAASDGIASIGHVLPIRDAVLARHRLVRKADRSR